jgi:Holliday junction resolvase-like predicted endonuclease
VSFSVDVPLAPASAPRWRIDIVARDGQTIVFVEVKTREGCESAPAPSPLFKRRRMASVALTLRRGTTRSSVFVAHVVSIDMSGQSRIELYQNAFDAS